MKYTQVGVPALNQPDDRKPGNDLVGSIHSAPMEFAALVVLIVAMFGGLIILSRPSAKSPRDFFQDYASARNVLLGRPTYSRIAPSIYQFNIHPPTSVLLALPFANLEYVQSALVWNLLSLVLLAGSLALLQSELRFNGSVTHLVCLTVMLGLWPPLWAHLLFGQFGIPILFLLTLAWKALRHG